MHDDFNSSKTTLSDESDCYVTIVDDCSFGRIGLQMSLLEFNKKKRIDISVFDTLLGNASAIYNVNKTRGALPRGNNTLVIRLPQSPLNALATLLLMGRLQLEIYSGVVLLSHVEPDLIRRILLGTGLNRTVKILDDRLPTYTLCKKIIQKSQIGCTLQENYFGTVFQPSSIFSPGETRALWYIISELPMYKQVMRSGVSSKTLYNQRHSALIKIKVRDVNELISRLLTRRIFLLPEKGYKYE